MTTPRGLVAKKWESYASGVIPPDAPQVQRIECRRAFYAGMQAALSMESEMSDGDSLDDPIDHAIMRGIVLELAQFVSDVKAGRA